jgi:hypothetical protein
MRQADIGAITMGPMLANWPPSGYEARTTMREPLSREDGAVQ